LAIASSRPRFDPNRWTKVAADGPISLPTPASVMALVDLSANQRLKTLGNGDVYVQRSTDDESTLLWICFLAVSLRPKRNERVNGRRATGWAKRRGKPGGREHQQGACVDP
jgi:hypothetical protein